jgi:colanic acid biosynthesis glycosyl transferase WcaI
MEMSVDSKLNVLVIAQYFPPDMGGGATRAYNVAKGLSLAGCNVTVVAAFPHYPKGNISSKYARKLLTIENDRDFKVIRTFVPPLASKGFANRLLLFVSFAFSSLFALPFAGKVSVVWAANPNIIAVFSSLIYKLTSRCPIVQNVDDLWPEALYDLGISQDSLFARLGEFIAKVAYKISSGLTPISSGYVDTLSGKYGISSGRIFVVPAGVDSKKFGRKPRQRAETDRFTVLYIGAFSPAYDFDQVLEAAKSLVLLSKVKFVIQGGGELGHELKRKVKERELGNVSIVEKIVSRDEVAEIMADADALLLPLNGIGSIELGISSKLYEYQAAGKPILCCSNGQPGRYVLESKSGLVVRPGDSQALAKSVIELTEKSSLACMMGENGRKYVTQEASIEGVGLKMKELFEKINSKTRRN